MIFLTTIYGKNTLKLTLTKGQLYLRDGTGNELLSLDAEGTNLAVLKEANIYGSEKVGSFKPGPETEGLHTLANRTYDLKDHLGNIRATVTDIRTKPGNIFFPTLNSASEYYPFGMETDKSFALAGMENRFGFNGKENDKTIGVQDYGFRLYKPELGRFLSQDPLRKDYPELTTYQFASNRSIEGIDLDGLEFAKAPNPKATTLVIVPTTYNTKNYWFTGFGRAAMENKSIDLLLAKNISEVTKYLNPIKTKYRNVIFADHGNTGLAGQLLGSSTFHQQDVEGSNKAEFQALTRNILTKGNIILLGCFVANPKIKGDKFIASLSNITGRNVYGNQGESAFGFNANFNEKPIGVKPPLSASNQSYYQISLDFSGKWSLATPGKVVNPNIGNLSFSSYGDPLITNKLENSSAGKDNKNKTNDKP